MAYHRYYDTGSWSSSEEVTRRVAATNRRLLKQYEKEDILFAAELKRKYGQSTCNRHRSNYE